MLLNGEKKQGTRCEEQRMMDNTVNVVGRYFPVTGSNQGNPSRGSGGRRLMATPMLNTYLKPHMREISNIFTVFRSRTI